MTFAVITAIVFAIDTSSADSMDYSGPEVTEVTDPASNRLIWMSTGRTAASGRGSIGFFGAPYLAPFAPYLTFLQGGYTPISLLQFNVTGSLGYWSAGTKAQLVPAMGLLKGVAIGADFGFYPQNKAIFTDDRISTYNIAASFGWEALEGHINAMQIVQGDSRPSGSFPTYLQFGLATQLRKSTYGGSKLIGELWYVRDYYRREFEIGLILLGIRTYKKSFVWEIATLISPRLFFGRGSSSNGLQFIPAPYLSFMWYI